MATYNGSRFIEEQIVSILRELGPHDELVISDDVSMDDTAEKIKAFTDSRIRLLRNSERLGYCGNFERSLLEARGDYVFLSDQDDVWIIGKVARMIKTLESCDLVISDAIIVDDKLDVICESHFVSRGVRRGFWHNFIKTRYVGACMAFRREVLVKALPFPKRHTLFSHDFWLTLVGEAFFKVDLLEEGLIKYRRHGANASSGGERSKIRIGRRLKTRFYCLFHILKRAVA